jgi:hypothetical protein
MKKIMMTLQRGSVRGSLKLLRLVSPRKATALKADRTLKNHPH